MTFTIAGDNVALYTLGLLLMGVALCRVWSAVLVVKRYTFSPDSFMAHVQKLITVNNIDRAIKLCNENLESLTDPPTLLAFKKLLTRANRPAPEQEGIFKEAQADLDAALMPVEAANDAPWGRIAADVVQGFAPALILFWLADSKVDWAFICLVYASGRVAAHVASGLGPKIREHRLQGQAALQKLHNLLATRQRGMGIGR